MASPGLRGVLLFLGLLTPQCAYGGYVPEPTPCGGEGEAECKYCSGSCILETIGIVLGMIGVCW